MKPLPLLFALLLMGCGASSQLDDIVTFIWHPGEIRWINKYCLVDVIAGSDNIDVSCNNTVVKDGAPILLFGDQLYELLESDGPKPEIQLGKLLETIDLDRGDR